MTVLSPMLVAHSMALAERYLKDTRPTAISSDFERLPGSPRPPCSWFVLQTVLHGEDKVAEALAEMGFDTYAPMMEKEIWHPRKSRLVTRKFRLFNRYLFAYLPVDARRWKTLEDIKELDYVLGANGVPCPVPAAEIERFKLAEDLRLFDDTKQDRFPKGSRVRAVGGPFGGFAGRVVSVAGRGVVHAMLEIFGRMVPVQFPYNMVEPD